MAVIDITKLSDADAVRFGDQVNIDDYVKYPDPPTDENEDTFDKRFSDAVAREEKVLARIEAAIAEPVDEYEKDAGEPMRSDVLQLTQVEFAKKYKMADIRKLAKVLEIKYTNMREAPLVSAIYEAANVR